MPEQLAQPQPESARQHRTAPPRSESPPPRRQPERQPGRPPGRSPVRPRTGWVLLALPVFGAALDEVIGSPLGLLFALCTVLASAWAALLTTRRGLWWVLPAPPLVVAAVTVLSQLLLHDVDLSGTKLATTALKWAVTGFPVMAFSLLAAVSALGLRQVLVRRVAVRSGRAARAVEARQVPVPRRNHHG
ncbi:hypothetical protein ABIA32_005587 [Streptacidiphilus sp. MAP12-20]|uniref:DUF6542 domain-containing protein n=1 Tax=Streptacidiphilus sp. MAP12-20 TaxID=3156299 RepID=UPI0035175139